MSKTKDDVNMSLIGDGTILTPTCTIQPIVFGCFVEVGVEIWITGGSVVAVGRLMWGPSLLRAQLLPTYASVKRAMTVHGSVSRNLTV